MTPPSPPTAPDSRPPIGRRIVSPTGLAVAALTGITLVFYHGLWLPGLVLIERDAYRIFLPFQQYASERLGAGELPQWFPYEGLGRSFIGLTATGVFHPFSSLYFLFSVPDAYRVSTLLSCLLAALGPFVLGRTLNFSRTGALLAGIAFALSGYIVSLTDDIQYLYPICVLPLFCAALEQALVTNRTWVVAPAAIWATVFLIGDMQTGYYYGFIALLWTATRAPAPRFTAWRRCALIACLAVLLAGIQLGPSWVLFTGSERAQPKIFHDEALAWSTHPLRLLTILASPVGDDVFATNGQEIVATDVQEKYIGYFWVESLYLGIPVIGLAFQGARYRRDLRMLVWLGCLALLLALGRWGGLYELFFQYVPLWSAFRYPEKLMGFVAFAAAMLAGAGLDVLRTGQGRVTPWLIGAVLCAAIGFSISSEVVGWWVTASNLPHASVVEVTASATRAFLFSAVSAMGVGAVVAGLQRRTFREELLLGVLLAVIALDLSRVHLGAYHTAPVEAATFTPPLAVALHAREGMSGLGRFRLVPLEEPRVVMPEQLVRSLGHYAAVMVARRHTLDALHGAQVHVESARRYLTGYKADLLSMAKNGVGTQAAARYNVAYYIGLRSRLQDPGVARGLIAELPDFDLILFRNPTLAKPRAYLSAKPERTVARIDPAALFARADFLSGEIDVIEAPDATLPGPATIGRAIIERYEPEVVQVRVETPQPAVLILLDAFDKGWTATIETGDELPIMRANALVRAVVVPAGSHAIAFSYQTPLLKAGAWVSLTGVLLCLGLIVHEHRRKRRSGNHA
ncbi:MAG: YfhO family protein [Nitrospirales bacterium]|nr:YfhO family protein [Nitrospirales bacterium]